MGQLKEGLKDILKEDDIIEDILISGDFFIYPPNALSHLAETLKGTKYDKDAILNRLDEFFKENKVNIPGVSNQNILNATIKE